MMQNRNQDQLLCWIDMVSIMLVDLTEYLDTHPFDEVAMDHYNHYQTLYQNALQEYAKAYEPLTLSTTTPENMWTWGVSKNPWERGAN